MLKILQASLQQYVNHQLPDVQAGFRKCRGTRDQIANIHWIIEKASEFQRFYEELSGILRRYLEDRFQVRAPKLTTEVQLYGSLSILWHCLSLGLE